MRCSRGLAVELVRVRGADGGRLGVADDRRQVRERAHQRLRREAGQPPCRVDDLQRIADGGRVVGLRASRAGRRCLITAEFSSAERSEAGRVSPLVPARACRVRRSSGTMDAGVERRSPSLAAEWQGWLSSCTRLLDAALVDADLAGGGDDGRPRCRRAAARPRPGAACACAPRARRDQHLAAGRRRLGALEVGDVAGDVGREEPSGSTTAGST